jgi:hypothetical protein
MSNAIKRTALRIALVSGLVRDIAIARGGTGHLRKPLSANESNHAKARRQMAKSSRKGNR